MRSVGRLPGGLSVPAALWALAARASVGGWLFAIAFPVYILITVVVLVGSGDWVIRAAAILLLASMLLRVRGRSRGVLVTPESQPALFDLVSQVAARLGRPVPDRVWLTGYAEVEAYAGVWPRRTELTIGRPLIPCLSTAELAGLIGHELSLLSHPWPALVVKVHRTWLRSVAGGRRDAQFAARVAPLVSTVEEAADAAAVQAAGEPATAARAVMFTQAALLQRITYAFESGAARIGGRRTAMLDAEDGWRRRIVHGDTESAPDVPELQQHHPGLAVALDLAGEPPLALANDPVTVATLSPVEERRLVAQSLVLASRGRVAWSTFADAPASIWLARAVREAADARRTVGRLLGHEPSDAELVDTLVRRPREVLAIALSIRGDDIELDRLPDGSERPTGYLLSVAEYLLLSRGWRLDHPAVRAVLIAPDGRLVDLEQLAASRIADLLGG